jgi:hypothetical protein
MRKQELVYVHGLLAGLRDHYQDRTGERVETPEYDSLDVRPTSIHVGKPAHEAAVFTLSRELAEGLRPGGRQLEAD